MVTVRRRWKPAPGVRGFRLEFELEGNYAFGSNERHRLVELGEAVSQEQAERLLVLLRDEAPKASGMFAAGLSASASRNWTGDIRGWVKAGGEHSFLLDLIRKGTRPHTIPFGGSAEQIAKGYPLSFYWEHGPNGPGLYHYWSIHHPGTKPNRFDQRALEKWLPGAIEAMRAIGWRVRGLDFPASIQEMFDVV